MKSRALLGGLLALVGACVVQKPGVLDAGDDEDTGSEEEGDGDPDDGPVLDEESDDGEPDLPEPEPEPEPEPNDGDGCAEKLDILVVIDNSGSMGEEQRQLIDAFPLLMDGLDIAGVDWRLAFTTTDSGSMWCHPQGTTPEHGRFVFSSCQTRLGDFDFSGIVNVADLACNDVCDVSPEQLAALPTTTALDPIPEPRPWLQREAGQLNLEPGVDVGDAIRCLLPQGINGCGFEQQLESTRRALARTTNPNAPEAGFMRDDASLLVLLVTDEVDCSVQPQFEEAAFGADGDRVFWENPNASFPTSAVCWNAGVDCVGDPSGYDDCVAADKDLMGNPAAPVDAVLFSVSRYQNILTMIEQSKRSLDDGLDVAVLSIHGVGLDGTITYADVDATNPAFQENFGIGPGCTAVLDPFGEPATAVPPVRIREVAEQLSSDPLSSICAASYDEFMLATLDRFVGSCQ
ncbi:MAG TPA: hypothetical protein VM869_03115 [Enhygromyxa sp.]|nr:hypothetical protein [Enhygromyxa sp.]